MSPPKKVEPRPYKSGARVRDDKTGGSPFMRGKTKSGDNEGKNPAGGVGHHKPVGDPQYIAITKAKRGKAANDK